MPIPKKVSLGNTHADTHDAADVVPPPFESEVKDIEEAVGDIKEAAGYDDSQNKAWSPASSVATDEPHTVMNNPGRNTMMALGELGLKPDKCGRIKSEKVRASATEKVKQENQYKFLRRVTCVMAVAVLLTASSSFVMSYWATSLLKDMEAADTKGAGVALTGYGTNDIVQVLSSTESQLNLYHTLVLDVAHLRTLDEIVYTVYRDDGTTSTQSEKVVKVQRNEGPNPSDLNVVISTYSQTKVIIDLTHESPVLVEDGKRSYICGEMRCANFKVDDPDLDVEKLDQQLMDLAPLRIVGNSTDVDRPKTCGKLPGMVQNGTSSGRRLLYDWGCCSGGLALGGDDGANCNEKPGLHKSKWGHKLSEACKAHDKCLQDAGADDCNKRGECDNTLSSAALKAGDCHMPNDKMKKWKWWKCMICEEDYIACKGLYLLISGAMAVEPNKNLMCPR